MKSNSNQKGIPIPQPTTRDDWEKVFDDTFTSEKVNGVQGVMVHRMYDPSPHDQSLTGAGLTNPWYVKEFIKKLILPQQVSSAISKRDEEWRKKVEEKVEDYFRGVIIIPDPQATKNNLINHLLNSMTKTE